MPSPSRFLSLYSRRFSRKRRNPCGPASTRPQQATRGTDLYNRVCSECHGDDLEGREKAPALAGESFAQRWDGATLKKLFERMEEMPPDNPAARLTAEPVRRYPRVSLERQRRSRGIATACLRTRTCWRPSSTPAGHIRRFLAKDPFTLERRRQSRIAWHGAPLTTRRLAARQRMQAKAAATAEWKTYGADLASTRYSPLDQINKDNFSKLKIAWRLTTNDFGPRPDTLYSATPLFVGNVLYTTVGTARTVVALNPTTGAVLWKHVEDEGPRGQNAARSGAGRGVAYWSTAEWIGSAHHLRDARLPDARARREDRRAAVDIRARRRRRLEARRRSGSRSRHCRHRPERHAAHCRRRHRRRRRAPLQRIAEDDEQRARVRARIRCEDRQASLDLSHGAQAWRVSDTTRGSRRAPIATATPARGRSSAPTSISASSTFRSRCRPATTTAATGRAIRCSTRVWSRSISRPASASGITRSTHHGVWDYDPPCAPVLYDVVVNGRRVKALAQPTKQAFLFVLESRNGQADLADRRARRAAVDGPERTDQPDAAVSDQTAAVRSPGRVG